MKNYMANKTFSRGVETLGAEASMVFVGNTKHNVPYMLKHTDLFEELPEKYYDSAFIDRLHAYIPGWEVDVIRGEMFSSGYGFVVDYLAEILRHLRSDDHSDRYKDSFQLSSDISTRDRDGINKTFSGLMKILFPGGGASNDEVEEVLRLAIEGRKRVKDQLMRIDTTYPDIDFSYIASGGRKVAVTTLEEDEYPAHYRRRGAAGPGEDQIPGSPAKEVQEDSSPTGNGVTPQVIRLREGHRVFSENQKGVSFDLLFGPYVRGAKKITLTDPYLRLFYQVRNLMEFIETVMRHKEPENEVDLHVITAQDEFKGDQQQANLISIEDSCVGSGINFTWEFDPTGTIHARHIVTDTGWKISLDRGLDVFQPYEMNNAFSFSNRLQEFRSAKAFEVTYMRLP